MRAAGNNQNGAVANRGAQRTDAPYHRFMAAMLVSDRGFLLTSAPACPVPLDCKRKLVHGSPALKTTIILLATMIAADSILGFLVEVLVLKDIPA